MRWVKIGFLIGLGFVLAQYALPLLFWGVCFFLLVTVVALPTRFLAVLIARWRQRYLLHMAWKKRGA